MDMEFYNLLGNDWSYFRHYKIYITSPHPDQSTPMLKAKRTRLKSVATRRWALINSESAQRPYGHYGNDLRKLTDAVSRPPWFIFNYSLKVEHTEPEGTCLAPKRMAYDNGKYGNLHSQFMCRSVRGILIEYWLTAPASGSPFVFFKRDFWFSVRLFCG